jgi:hypothetical protein
MPLVIIQSRNPASPGTASIDQSSFGALKLGDFADPAKGRVERHLMKLPDQLPGLGLVARGRQLVVNGQAHVVSLLFMVQRHGQRVTHEMALAAQRLVARRGEPPE